jgi:anti-sigma B factor antagonist
VQLHLDAAERGRFTVVTATGEIDLATVPTLKKTLDDLVMESRVHLVVDLTPVTFLDSTGLGALVGARRKVYPFKGSLAIVCDNERILKLFTITGLDRVFTLHRTVEDAVESPDAVVRDDMEQLAPNA